MQLWKGDQDTGWTRTWTKAGAGAGVRFAVERYGCTVVVEVGDVEFAFASENRGIVDVDDRDAGRSKSRP